MLVAVLGAVLVGVLVAVLGDGVQRLGTGLESRQVEKWHYKGERATEKVYTILADEGKAR